MTLSQLLKARETLVRQAEIANLAFAYDLLSEFGRKIARANLRGEVHFKSACPEEDRYWATLTAITGSQAAIEEHFTDEELTDYADAVAFATGENDFEIQFRLEDFTESFLVPLRRSLEHAGVTIDVERIGSQSTTLNDR